VGDALLGIEDLQDALKAQAAPMTQKFAGYAGEIPSLSSFLTCRLTRCTPSIQN